MTLCYAPPAGNSHLFTTTNVHNFVPEFVKFLTLKDFFIKYTSMLSVEKSDVQMYGSFSGTSISIILQNHYDLVVLYHGVLLNLKYLSVQK